MKKSLISGIAAIAMVAALSFSPAPAKADTLNFNFMAADGSFDFSGTAITDGSNIVTSCVGCFVQGFGAFAANSGAINAVIDPSNSQQGIYASWAWDGKFLATAPFFSNTGSSGFLATFVDLNNNTDVINPYYNGLNILLSLGLPSASGLTYNPGVLVGDASVSATPLPGTWMMMLSGLALIGFFGFKRKDSKHNFGAARLAGV